MNQPRHSWRLEQDVPGGTSAEGLPRISIGKGRETTGLPVILKELLVPLALLLLFGQAVALPPVVHLLDRYRPRFCGTVESDWLQGQILHVLAPLREASGDKTRVLVAGSSAVVNDIDQGLINALWRERKLDLRFHKFGMTGLLAYELLFYKKYLLDARNLGIIYLYNTWSFANRFHPDAVVSRFHGREYLDIALRHPDLPGINGNRVAAAVIGQAMPLVHDQALIKREILDWVTGRAAVNALDYDIRPDQPVPPLRPRVLAAPASESFWYRAAALESNASSDTLGYEALRLFLAEARRKGVPVAVMPAPEAEFAAYGPYLQGLDQRRIDNWVRQITEEEGAVYVDRSLVATLEKDDHMFHDELHLHDVGRERFSRLLTETIPQLFPVPEGQ